MHNNLNGLEKRGRGLVEYAVILVLIAIVVFLIITFLEPKEGNDTLINLRSGLQ